MPPDDVWVIVPRDCVVMFGSIVLRDYVQVIACRDYVRGILSQDYIRGILCRDYVSELCPLIVSRNYVRGILSYYPRDSVSRF